MFFKEYDLIVKVDEIRDEGNGVVILRISDTSQV
jgi:hypothetical protein